MAKVPECVVVKLLSIVENKNSRDFEVANDALLDEALDILLSDGGQGFCFNPFGEVVNSHNEELELPYCRKKGPYYVESLLSERPLGNHRSELFQWLSYDVIKALTLVVCFHIGLGVLLHGRLVVPCSYKLVN